MQNYRVLGAQPPDPLNNPPIADFWLRACVYLCLKDIMLEITFIYYTAVWGGLGQPSFFDRNFF